MSAERRGPADDTRADLTMRAGAKEGLLNQHSSEKALRRVRDALAVKLGGVEVSGEPVPGENAPSETPAS